MLILFFWRLGDSSARSIVVASVAARAGVSAVRPGHEAVGSGKVSPTGAGRPVHGGSSGAVSGASSVSSSSGGRLAANSSAASAATRRGGSGGVLVADIIVRGDGQQEF